LLKLKSELVSNVLKILLWALVFLQSLELASMLVYVSSYDAFMDNLYEIYGFILLLIRYLYIIVIVVYLIWIYRVHMDMQSRFPMFDRSPGMSLVFNMVPLFNLYGVPAVYIAIGNQFATHPQLRDKGRFIRALALPLLISFLVSYFLNQYIKLVDEVSDGTLLLSSIAQFGLYCIFLQLCLKISQGLEKTVVSSSAPIDDPNAEAVEG